jgi:hypothetical protein
MLIDSNSTAYAYNPLDFAFFDLDQEQPDMDLSFAKVNQTCVTVESISLTNQEPYYIYAQ